MVTRVSSPRALAPGSMTAMHSSTRLRTSMSLHVECRPKCLDPRVVEHDVDHVAHVLAGADDLCHLP